MSEQRIYTLTLEQIDSMLEDAAEGFGVCRGMLAHYLEKQETDQICALLAEMLWANFNITKILEEEIFQSESIEDEQIVISEKMLGLLQTLVFSKEMAKQELSRFSISTKLN